MRMMLRATIPAAKGNQAIQDGSLQKAIEATIEKTQPEAAYFALQDGQRAAYFFFEIDGVTDIPSITEPLWMSLEANLDLQPAMNTEELQIALQKAFG